MCTLLTCDHHTYNTYQEDRFLRSLLCKPKHPVITIVYEFALFIGIFSAGTKISRRSSLHKKHSMKSRQSSQLLCTVPMQNWLDVILQEGHAHVRNIILFLFRSEKVESEEDEEVKLDLRCNTRRLAPL